MRTTYKYILAFSFLILFIAFILGKTEYSVVPEVLYNPQDTIHEKPQDQSEGKKTRYPVKKTQVESYDDIDKKFPIDLRDPSNVKTEIVYDTENNCYIFRTKIGDEVIETPYVMDSGEFIEYTRRRQMTDYFKLKNKELAQKGEKSGDDFSLKNIRVNLGPAEKIFGPGGVRIKTQGSIELSSGIKRTSIDNPALSQNNRTKTLFDFDEKIQLRANASVGDKMNFNLNYDTQATFDFDSKKIKLAYEGKEDEIIRHLEAGNVSMTTSNSLINGGAALFGIKADLQFGKLKVNAVIAQQESNSQTVSSKNGVQTSSFEITPDQYDVNQHFFLNEYFRDIYDKSLSALPYIKSGITINRIQVWVTNKKAVYDEARNVVAFADLGEKDHIHNSLWTSTSSSSIPQNGANDLYSTIKSSYPTARDISQVTSTFSGVLTSGKDYEKIESARLMSSSEYIVNTKLGYISLKSKLQSDEVLAVAYEYKMSGSTYQVGEFSSDVTSSYSDTTTNSGALFLKLVKPTSLSPTSYLWNLMMKNVYSLGASQIQSTNFTLHISRQVDTTGVYLNYLTEGDVAKKQLLRVLRLDRLNSNKNPYPDGKFDFVDGYTVLPSMGRVIFPVLEPFGSFLKTKIGDETIAEKYIYQELYDSTQTKAKQFTEKNKFKLYGTYQGSSNSTISLNATNVTRGSVVVTAGGTTLTEGTDYTVDYVSGTVAIINQSIIDAGTSVSVSLESQGYSTQKKTLTGLNLSYDFSKQLSMGATIMHLSETPLTTKTAFGNESVNNTIFGMNVNYNAQSTWLTNLVDKLPFVNESQPSQINFTGEFAQLIAGHNSSKYGDYSYLDDFETAESSISIMTPSSWSLASTPYDDSSSALFSEASLSNDVNYGKNRALLSWFTVARLFTQSSSSATPKHIKNDKDQLSNHFVRQISETELYPEKEISTTDVTYISPLNLSFYPTERGPYNLDATNIDSNGKLTNPTTRWGGITRKLTTTDFETANIGYIEFWMLDPFVYDSLSTDTEAGGDLYFNLGEISEDILKDGKKFYESGLPIDGDTTTVSETVWGKVPKRTSTTVAFDDSNGTTSRKLQDVGLDGLSTDEELEYSTYADYLTSYKKKLSTAALDTLESDPFSAINDPAGDNYHFYRGTDYDNEELSILNRYKHYNGTDVNSVDDSSESYSTSAKSTPDVEDINGDNTLNETESYYQYKVELYPSKMVVGSNYIADSKTVSVSLANGKTESVKWYQFKIPISDYEKVVGDIDGFTSIRFIRMFMTNFPKTTFLRFGTLDLVRNDWREYENSLISSGSVTGNGTIDVGAVNIEENSDKTPVNYVLPPTITRSTDASQSQVIEQNEQAMSLKVETLDPNDSRAAYKTVNYDLRKYKRLQMFTHAEELADGTTLTKGDIAVFIRLGTDYRNNYYEYEIPLTITPAGTYSNESSTDRYIVWPDANMFDFPLELLKNIKLDRNKAKKAGEEGVSYTSLYYEYDPDKPNNKVSVMGNPSLGEVKVMMIGVRNKSTIQQSGEVWVNELRLHGFNDDGGWAARGSLNVVLSGLGTINLSARKETDGFGALDQGLQERREDTYENYNISTNLELGRFLPEKMKLSAPFYYNYSKEISTPKYNAYDTDVTLKESLSSLTTKQQKDSLMELNTTRTTTKGLAFNNVKFNIKSKTPMPYDPANLSFSYSFNETKYIDPITAYDSKQNMKMSVSYSYSPIVKSWSPFKNTKSKSPSMKSLKEFSFNFLPSSIAFNSYIQRSYEETKLRDLSDSASTSSSDLLTWSDEFYWNRDFYLTWDLTKNLKFDFQSGTKAEIEAPYTQVNKKENRAAYENWKDSVLKSILHLGKPLYYQQSMKLRYNLPFSYFPITNWINSAANYESTYSWTRASTVSSSDDEDDEDDEDLELGNTITNTKSLSINSKFNLVALYNKSSFLKKVNQKFETPTRASDNRGQNNPRQPRRDGSVDKKKKFQSNIVLRLDTTVTIRHNLNSKNVRLSTRHKGKVYPVKFKKIDKNSLLILTKDTVHLQVVVLKILDSEESPLYKIAQFVTRGAMSLRSLTVNYSLQSGSTITGFIPNIGDAFGQSKSDFGFAPGWKYAFGMETGVDFIKRLRGNDWLVMDTTNATASLLTHTEKFDLKAQLEPIKGLKIDLEAQRSLTRNTEVEYMYSGMPKTYSGSYSISTISLATSLKSVGSKNGYYSKAFETFLNNRSVIAGRYDEEYSQLLSGTSDEDLLDESSLNSSDVLIPAFLAAYSGKSARKVALTQFPSLSSILPNWKITYDGLITLPWVRDKFKSLRLSHGYSSQYQVGSYSSYSGWTELSDDRGYVQSVLTGSYLPSSPYDISSVTITEKFNPLIGVDGTLNNNLTFSMKYNNARTVTLSTSSYQIVEALSNEFIIGMSHKISEFNKTLGIKSKAKGVNNDLDIKVDFSHKTIYALLRKIEDVYSQATSGTTINTLKVSTAYTLSKSVTLGAYLDQIMNKPLVSATSYKTTTTNFGLSLKFNLTQ
ncbi:MAG: hypothetical protein H6Q14_1808 [Bacteroidetes bacterium]|nr:hypothetical protein [Bacteroidota bacterium]